MTSERIHFPEKLANEIGRAKQLHCKYAYDSAKRKFVYQFFRVGRYLGATSDPAKVVKQMEKYACAN